MQDNYTVLEYIFLEKNVVEFNIVENNPDLLKMSVELPIKEESKYRFIDLVNYMQNSKEMKTTPFYVTPTSKLLFKINISKENNHLPDEEFLLNAQYSFYMSIHIILKKLFDLYQNPKFYNL